MPEPGQHPLGVLAVGVGEDQPAAGQARQGRGEFGIGPQSSSGTSWT